MAYNFLKTRKGFVFIIILINFLSLLYFYSVNYNHAAFINDYNEYYFRRLKYYFQHLKQFHEDEDGIKCTSLSSMKFNQNNKNINGQLEAISHLSKVRMATQQIFNYFSNTIRKTNGILNNSMKREIIEHVSDIKNVLGIELEKASKSLKVEEFRKYHLNMISREIQSKIYFLQNPPTELCQKVPKLICRLNVGFGFGSAIHEVLWCLISAYHSGKTVILIVDHTNYFNLDHKVWEGANSDSGISWEDVFVPLSTTCNSSHLPWFQLIGTSRPNNVFTRESINYLPKDIGPQLIKLIDDPLPWFHGQFIGRLMRPQEKLKQYLLKMKQQLNYRHPIVGVQVRRSDKLRSEASYYPISDYMIHVQDFYHKLSLTQNVSKRLVYVASDDPTVLPSLIKQYPDYEFVGSASNARIASSHSTRYSTSSLWGILTDVFLLAESDHIVCTLSSAICRLSVQLMRYQNGDGSFKYQSIDVPFHYHYALTPMRVAAFNHEPISLNEWNLKIGDPLYERIRDDKRTEWFNQAVNGRGWDSFFYATNTTTNQIHYKLYPYYKDVNRANGWRANHF